MLLKKWMAALVVVIACTGVRADDSDCQTCKEKKPKCDSCSPTETVKRCGNPVKNFFVHSVGGTIGNGLNKVPCKFEGAYNSTAQAVTPKSDCGCNK